VLIVEPRDENESVKSLTDTGSAPQPATKKRILIVDDEPKVCQLLKDFLEQQGYEVFEAHQGDSAISKAQMLHPDLLLLDVLLPGGLDGVQVYHRLKGRVSTRRIPVMFITATEPVGSVKTQQLPLGEKVAVVGKPFYLDTVLREIHRLIGPEVLKAGPARKGIAPRRSTEHP